MKYAIVAVGGKQVKIKEGQTIKVTRQSQLNMDVLMYSDGKEMLIGSPVLDNVVVKAKITGEERGKKVTIARFKSKSRYRKRKGHRQPLSVISIESISKKGKAAEKEEAKASTEKATEKKTPVKKTTEKKAVAKKKPASKKSKKVKKEDK